MPVVGSNILYCKDTQLTSFGCIDASMHKIDCQWRAFLVYKQSWWASSHSIYFINWHMCSKSAIHICNLMFDIAKS